MKITKNQLKQIIKEELEATITQEGIFDMFKGKKAGNQSRFIDAVDMEGDRSWPPGKEEGDARRKAGYINSRIKKYGNGDKEAQEEVKFYRDIADGKTTDPEYSQQFAQRVLSAVSAPLGNYLPTDKKGNRRVGSRDPDMY
jgi:hypothetical protein